MVGYAGTGISVGARGSERVRTLVFLGRRIATLRNSKSEFHDRIVYLFG